MKRLPLFLLLLAGLGFVLGLAHLFRLRFAAGDVYPPYSSLRADPLGTKALYLALDRLGRARRHFQPLDQLGEGRGTTLFFLGADPEEMEFTPTEYRHLEGFVLTGGRLVLALFPTYQPLNTNLWAGPPAGPGPGSRPGKAQPAKARPAGPAEAARLKPEPITRRWKLALGHAELPKDAAGVYRPQRALRQMAAPLPDALPCHTALVFENPDPVWRVVYARPSGRAVLIERRLGAGTIVLCADAWPLSNQALRQERQTALLAWLLGPNRRAVFEESHLGVSEQPGLASLARRYRLHGLAAVLLALAGLFIWQNAVPLVPPEATGRAGTPEVVPGRDSAAGFLNLLRRHVPAEDLLAVCLLAWKRACARHTPRARLEALQAVIDAENARPAGERNPVATYRRFCHILARGGPHRQDANRET